MLVLLDSHMQLFCTQYVPFTVVGLVEFRSGLGSK